MSIVIKPILSYFSRTCAPRSLPRLPHWLHQCETSTVNSTPGIPKVVYSEIQLTRIQCGLHPIVPTKPALRWNREDHSTLTVAGSAEYRKLCSYVVQRKQSASPLSSLWRLPWATTSSTMVSSVLKVTTLEEEEGN